LLSQLRKTDLTLPACLLSMSNAIFPPHAQILIPLIECSIMTNPLVHERDWSPLCKPCLSRTKSVQFRDAVLDRSKPLKYNIKSGNLVDQCVLCSLVARQLDYRESGSSLTFEVASVSISRWSEPSELYLSVDNYHSLNLKLFTRPGGHTVISISKF
jgi:hypothetical protein